MTLQQKAMIVKALECAADKAQNAMLHAKCTLIDLEYNTGHAATRAKSLIQEGTEALHAATMASAWLDYATSGKES
jgi:hypothetical protein